MLHEDDEKKSFTFIWKIENANYCWQKELERLESPLFKVDETKLNLKLYPKLGDKEGYIGFWLCKNGANSVESEQLDCELAFLASDGTILRSLKKVRTFENGAIYGSPNFATRNEVFFERRATFLHQNTLTAYCRIWKTVGEFSKEVQCFSRTHIGIEKRSFQWNIENFSTLTSGVIQSYEIKSLDTDEQLMRLELFVTGGHILDKTVRFAIIPNYRSIKKMSFQLSVVNATNNLVECFQQEFWCGDPITRKEFDLFRTKKLMEKSTVYLPNDVLSLQCDFSFSSGIVQQEINSIISDRTFDEKDESVKDGCLSKEKDLTVPKFNLINNLKSLVNNSCLSDVKLRTKYQTYAAHSFILGARSPVFKAMFSNDMKEKINECVDIEDLNDDTVLRLLRYIYSADVEELQWSSAAQLYEAADKYEVLDLKNICSSYLRNNLCPSNACEVLELADLHQDEDLKRFVQDFILKHGKRVINSEEWEQLAETNLKLAYETIRLKYKD